MSSAAVDSVTAEMATTTLNNNNETAPDAGEKTTSTQEVDAGAASAAEGRRLYIGNLAYATTEGELKEFFKDYLVETTSIPTNPRTTRPVGYAFVDLSTPSEAERAIAELNGKSILDRKVSIQLARKPEAHGEGHSGGENASGNENRRRGSTRGRGRGRGRGSRAAGRSGRNRKDGAEGGDVTGEGATSGPTNGTDDTIAINTKTAKTPQRDRKQRGPPEDGIPSKTKVMVANLPYDLREDKLMEIFQDYSPTSAKIALRPIPRFMVKKLQARNEPRKGRGFGFVTLATEELQQKACNEMNGREIEGREIAVKVAIDSPGKEDDDPNSPSDGPTGATEDETPSKAEASGSVRPDADVDVSVL
jgi:RNA recognition motif-containing protein